MKKGKSIYDKLANIFKKIPKKTKEKYNELTEIGKKLLWLWGTIIIVVIILIIVCANNNGNIGNHRTIEKKMNKAALKYAEEKNIFGSKDQKTLITLEELIDSKYLNKKDITDSTCSGYVLYYIKEDSDSGKANSYLKCKKYTTEGYKKQ